MSSFKDAYLTDIGAELLAKSISSGSKIEFVKMIVGSGVYEDAEKTKEALRRRTELKEQRQEFPFASVSASGQNAVKLKALINNKNLLEGYRITEIGIVAKIKGDTTTEGELYSVAIAEEADYLPAEDTPITYIQEYYTKISNAESVTINIESGTYALAEDLMAVRVPVYEESAELENLTSGEEVETKWAKISRAVKELKEHLITKASSTVLGHVKLSDSSAITDGTGYALPATEKNASIEGTLANQIDAINNNLVHIDAIGRDLTSDNNNHTLDISNYAFLIVTLRDNAVNSRTLEPIIISRPGELTEPISIDYCLHANNGELYIVTSSMAINNTDKYFSFAKTLMSHIGNIYGIQANAPSVIKVVGIPFSNNPN